MRKVDKKTATEVTAGASDVVQEHTLMSEQIYIERNGARNGTVHIQLIISSAEKGKRRTKLMTHCICVILFWL